MVALLLKPGDTSPSLPLPKRGFCVQYPKLPLYNAASLVSPQLIRLRDGSSPNASGNTTPWNDVWIYPPVEKHGGLENPCTGDRPVREPPSRVDTVLSGSPLAGSADTQFTVSASPR